MNDLIDTTEMYLRTIFELEEEGIVPLRARIAERLHQSGPTVSQTVARMERDGLLTVEGDRHLQLSETGRALATAVMRKHRLAECLLVDVIGLDYADVHEEACRWEHVMSEAVERKLLSLLGNPTVSPFGNPIPGLDALGGVPLGVVDDAEYVSAEVALAPGDVLLAVSDGVTEAEAPGGSQFGEAGVEACLNLCRGREDALLHTLLSRVRTHEAGRPAGDDLAALLLRIPGPESGAGAPQRPAA